MPHKGNTKETESFDYFWDNHLVGEEQSTAVFFNLRLMSKITFVLNLSK